jgi:1,4-dihydroxy-2-naphthoate octaprenyltransferase
MNVDQHAKITADAVAGGLALASWVGWLPTALGCIASVLAIIYHVIQIWRTVRKPKESA